jgi:hypothetical protein
MEKRILLKTLALGLMIPSSLAPAATVAQTAQQTTPAYLRSAQ